MEDVSYMWTVWITWSGVMLATQMRSTEKKQKEADSGGNGSGDQVTPVHFHLHLFENILKLSWILKIHVFVLIWKIFFKNRKGKCIMFISDKGWVMEVLMPG